MRYTDLKTLVVLALGFLFGFRLGLFAFVCARWRVAEQGRTLALVSVHGGTGHLGCLERSSALSVMFRG